MNTKQDLLETYTGYKKWILIIQTELAWPRILGWIFVVAYLAGFFWLCYNGYMPHDFN